MNQDRGLTPHEWAVFGTFALLLAGLSLFSPAIATYVGLGVMAVIVIRNPDVLGLGGGGQTTPPGQARPIIGGAV